MTCKFMIEFVEYGTIDIEATLLLQVAAISESIQ
jgi:hypothetical protein